MFLLVVLFCLSGEVEDFQPACRPSFHQIFELCLLKVNSELGQTRQPQKLVEDEDIEKVPTNQYAVTQCNSGLVLFRHMYLGRVLPGTRGILILVFLHITYITETAKRRILSSYFHLLFIIIL
jgi:hypothetical protein